MRTPTAQTSPPASTSSPVLTDSQDPNDPNSDTYVPPGEPRASLTESTDSEHAPAEDENLDKIVEKAMRTLEKFVGPTATAKARIDPGYFDHQQCKGVAIYSTGKAGVVLSVRIGHGIIIPRFKHGWGAPIPFRAEGFGLGFQVGGSKDDIISVLPTREMLFTWAEGRDSELLGMREGCIGNHGVEVQGDSHMVKHVNTSHHTGPVTFTANKGLFGGYSVEGLRIHPMHRLNRKIYGADWKVRDLLQPKYPVPAAIAPVHHMLEEAAKIHA
eukprot:TRINITY_DN604_c0_g1_i1.p1 TRINITY_DN604_c0_g1~~TRINITY_DN604_c0_g1_i1.p1  ORF type:complete len:271 (+),score=48.35 TRINITY_DN604_c0_g1_i1:195-1007(+)